MVAGVNTVSAIPVWLPRAWYIVLGSNPRSNPARFPTAPRRRRGATENFRTGSQRGNVVDVLMLTLDCLWR
jgi:hypothetical protein